MRSPASVLRRLDAWAALLLGVLVSLAVIILLATPGPWHRVVPSVPRVQIAPSPPVDVAVFVATSHRRPQLQAAVVVHIDYTLPQITLVLVPRDVACRLADAGLQPLASIVESAGPAAGAAGLGTALGMPLDAWIQVEPTSLRNAFPGFMAQTDAIRATRLRLEARADPWVRHPGELTDIERQLAFLRVAAAGWRPDALNLVAFGNYVLGAQDVKTDLKLQAASALGAVLDRTRPDDVTLSALPVRIVTRKEYRLSLPDPRATFAFGAAFAAGAGPPSFAPAATPVPVGDRVLVLCQPLGVGATPFARAFETQLRRYGSDVAGIDLVACSTPSDVTRAVAASPDLPPPAVVIAFGRSAGGPTSMVRVQALQDAAIKATSARSLPTVVSVPPLPLDKPQAVALAKQIADGAALADLAVSPADRLIPVGGPLSSADAARWAVATVDLLVRDVQAGAFAPRLTSTRLGFSFARRHATIVAVVDLQQDRRDHMVARIDNLGYATTAVTASSLVPRATMVVYYRAGARGAALSLAGDLGLPQRLVQERTSLPQAVTLLMPGVAL